MLRIQHPTGYLKKEEFKLQGNAPQEEQNHTEQSSKSFQNLKRVKRADDDLELPEDFEVGHAIGGEDCFFDAVAKGLKQLKPEMEFTVKSLRKVCKELAIDNQQLKAQVINDVRNPKDPTVIVSVFDVSDDELWNTYLGSIEYSSNDMDRMQNDNPSLYQSLTSLKYGSTLQTPIWGRPEIEGRMICKEYGIKLHVIEKHDVEGKEIWTNQIIDESGSRSISNIDYNDINTIHVINKGLAHFEPILDNRKLIEKQLNRLKIRIEKITGTDIQKSNQKELTVSSTLKESFEPLSPIDEELFNAAEQGNLGAVKRLIEEKGANFKAIDKSGRTPLHLAAYDGYLNIVEYLIEKGDDVITKDNNGLTLLHFAADGGKLDTVKYLIEKGANVNIISDDGSTPICWAAYNGNLDIVKYLIEKGADVNAKNNEGETPLHSAALSGKVESVKAMIEAGSNINATDYEGYTPLHSASMMRCIGKVRALINAGANVNAKSHIGRTPLHQAVIMSELKNVRKILEAGGDLDIRDYKGYTPIDVAYMAGVKNIVEELTAYQDSTELVELRSKQYNF